MPCIEKKRKKPPGMIYLAVFVKECHVRLKSAVMVTIAQEDTAESFLDASAA